MLPLMTSVVNILSAFIKPYWLGGVLLLLLSCAQVEQLELHGETMGTTYSVKYYGGKIGSEDLQKQIEIFLRDFNQVFSTYIPDSEISLLNQASDAAKVRGIKVTPGFQRVLDRALSIAALSEGYFDPTIYPLVSLWKVNFKKQNHTDFLPDRNEILEAKSKVGYARVKSSPGKVMMGLGMSVDLSAIAKGSGVDGVSEVLEQNGIVNYLVEIGGELRAKGVNPKGDPWQVMISPPWDDLKKASLAAENDSVVIPLSDGAIATSGDYLNYFTHEGVRYSHLIDPHTGMPIRHYVTSVSVLRDTCEEADGWATALIVMGEKGIEFSEANGIPAIFMVVEAGSDTIKIVKNSLVEDYLN